MARQELYQERPTHSKTRQPPEPELKPSTPETDKATTHPSLSSPDLIQEPESISNYPLESNINNIDIKKRMEFSMIRLDQELMKVLKN